MLKTIVIAGFFLMSTEKVASQALPKKFDPDRQPSAVKATMPLPKSQNGAPNVDSGNTRSNRQGKTTAVGVPREETRLPTTFTTTMDCTLEINGVSHGELKRVGSLRLQLEDGFYKIRAAALGNQYILDSSFTISNNGRSILLPVKELVEKKLLERDSITQAVASISREVKPVALTDSSKVVIASKKTLVSPVIDQLATALAADMIKMPGGKFKPAAPSTGRSRTEPESVVIKAFSIGKFEVTQSQWKTVMGYNNSGNVDCDDCPVENVSLNEVTTFLNRLNQGRKSLFRLPTSAEWEYVAQMDKGKPGRSFEDLIKSTTWSSMYSLRTSHPVGKKTAHDSGVYDLFGNVAEWCIDTFNKPEKGNVNAQTRSPSRANNPIMRGGSFANDYKFIEALERNPDYKSRYLGFRLVMVPN